MTPSDVQSIDSIEWEDDEDAVLYRPMVEEARSFLEGFQWCRKVETLLGGKAVPGIVALFFATIIPAEQGVDENVWVIVGDLPPAYLVPDDASDSDAALLIYIEHMEDWVQAARAGEPVDDLIPVNVDPTPEYAELLASRLGFLRSNVIAE